MSLNQPDDQDIVIVGATGDLAKRKLLPALYNLHVDGLLPLKGQIIGYTRTQFDDAGLRDEAKTAVTEFSRRHLDESAWPSFAQRLTFVSGKDQGLAALKLHCALPNRVIYLSIPPSAFADTIRGLGEAGLVRGTRLVVEKPFGHDLASSRALGKTIQDVFAEEQVFRIDHYLGKETVQNILVLRFGNSVFERVWNRDAIDHVQFTVAEAIGVEGRGSFYEETGAMRDILQNHIFQVLALLTMEAPGSFEAEHVRDEKAKLFGAMRPLRREDVVRGQYARMKMDGVIAPGYLDEPGVAPDSQTETYAAVKLWIDNWRWAGVPFYLRTGKRLPIRRTEAVIQFKDVPVPFFHSAGVQGLVPNQLVISIQPEEAISFHFMAKAPGVDVDVEPVTMTFSYENSFPVQPAEAYERLLHDVMDGDHTLFARTDSVDRSWEVVDPVIRGEPTPIHPYPAGSWGPPEADKLIDPDKWRVP